MQIRIGMTQTPKELEVDLGTEQDGDTVMKEITDAVASEATMMWFTDRKGRRVGVATAKIAYIEVVGPDEEGRRVGFSTGFTT